MSFDEDPAAPTAATTNRAIRRYRGVGLLWILMGLALIVLSVVVATTTENSSARLARSGQHTNGTVVGIKRGVPVVSADGVIVVEFAVDGVSRAVDINLDSNSPSYSVGESVDVIYDPQNLSNVRTSRESNDPTGAVGVFILGIVVGPMGVGVGSVILRRARRWRLLVAAGGWRKVQATYREVPAGRSVQPLLQLRDGSSVAVRGVTSSLRWRLRPLRGVATVWVVGPIEGVMALTPTIDGPLFEVRPARSSKKQKRWESKFHDRNLE
jgi:hypothetical protein